MSFLWYSAFGAALCIIIALLASLVFGTTDTSELDPALVAPVIRRFLPPKKYSNVQMEDGRIVADSGRCSINGVTKVDKEKDVLKQLVK